MQLTGQNSSISGLDNCGKITLDMGGMIMDLYSIFNMFKNIISTFFQNGIWVIGCFYLLNKTFESDRLIHFSKYAIGIVLTLLFFYSVIVSI